MESEILQRYSDVIQLVKRPSAKLTTQELVLTFDAYNGPATEIAPNAVHSALSAQNCDE